MLTLCLLQCWRFVESVVNVLRKPLRLLLPDGWLLLPDELLVLIAGVPAIFVTFGLARLNITHQWCHSMSPNQWWGTLMSAVCAAIVLAQSGKDIGQPGTVVKRCDKSRRPHLGVLRSMATLLLRGQPLEAGGYCFRCGSNANFPDLCSSKPHKAVPFFCLGFCTTAWVVHHEILSKQSHTWTCCVYAQLRPRGIPPHSSIWRALRPFTYDIDPFFKSFFF